MDGLLESPSRSTEVRIYPKFRRIGETPPPTRERSVLTTTLLPSTALLRHTFPKYDCQMPRSHPISIDVMSPTGLGFVPEDLQ